MDPYIKDTVLEEKIKKLLENPPQHKFRAQKRSELIARLYKIEDEKKTIVNFIPLPMARSAALALAVCALFIFGYKYLFSPLYPVVLGMKGDVQIYRMGESRWITASSKKVKLYKDDFIRTAKRGEADVIIPGLYHLRMKPGSELIFKSTRSRISSKKIEFVLSEGKVFANYRKEGKNGKPFSVMTPEAALSVTGTDFMVETNMAAERTWVGVLDGAVEVSGLGESASVLVEAGEKTTVNNRRKPAKPSRLLEDELRQMEELYLIGEKPQVALLISTGKARSRELLSLTPLYIASEGKGTLPDEIRRIADTFNRAIESRSKEKHIETIKEFENLVDLYPNDRYDVQFLLFIGAYYEYLDEHLRAIEIFEKIIRKYPESNLLSLAQSAIGIIYEEKLQLPEKARLAYSKIITDFPNSPEAYEAESGLARLLR